MYPTKEKRWKSTYVAASPHQRLKIDVDSIIFCKNLVGMYPRNEERKDGKAHLLAASPSNVMPSNSTIAGQTDGWY